MNYLTTMDSKIFQSVCISHSHHQGYNTIGTEFVLRVLPLSSRSFFLISITTHSIRPFRHAGFDHAVFGPCVCVQVYWSGFSSASPDRTVALGFAGPGGVLLRIRVQPRASKARNVRLLSAITIEQEVILPLTQLIMTLPV